MDNKKSHYLSKISEAVEAVNSTWGYVTRAVALVRAEGATVKEIHEALGLAEALGTGVESPELSDLKIRYEGMRWQNRTAEEDLELRDLAEAAVYAGVRKADIATALGVTRATVRNLLHPGYMTQTPEERAAYREERAAVRDLF